MIIETMTSLSLVVQGPISQNAKGARATHRLKPTSGDVAGFTINALLLLRSVPAIQEFESSVAVGSAKFFRKCFLEDGEHWQILAQYERQIDDYALKLKNLFVQKGLKGYPELLHLTDELLAVRIKLECMLQEHCEALISIRNQTGDGTASLSVAAIENKMDALLYGIELHKRASGFISICSRFAPQRTACATNRTSVFLKTTFSFANRKDLSDLCKDKEQQQRICECLSEMKKAAGLA